MEENERNYELEKSIREREEKERALQLAQDIINFVGVYTDRSPNFIEAMERQHRTHIQSFTKLALKWIEHVASDSFSKDGRTVASHVTCKKMLTAFREKVAQEEGYTGDLDSMFKPSDYIPMV